MVAPRKRRPIERPTARKVVDEVLGGDKGAEVGAMPADRSLVETLDVVTAEAESAEASSLRRTLMKSREHWNLDLVYGGSSRQRTENNSH